MFSSTSSARRALGSIAVTRAPDLRADRRQQRGLAAGPRAQVQPATAVVVERRQRQRPGHQLAALVLDQRRAVADGVQLTRVTAGQVDRVRRVATDRPVHGLGEITRRQHPGPGGQMHQRPLVVGGQQRIQLACVGAERVGERLADPARMGVHERDVTDGVGVGGRGEFVDP